MLQGMDDFFISGLSSEISSTVYSTFGHCGVSCHRNAGAWINLLLLTSSVADGPLEVSSLGSEDDSIYDHWVYWAPLWITASLFATNT